MPGRYSHSIYIKCNIRALENLDLPVPFFPIKKMLRRSAQEIEKQVDFIVPELAEYSQVAQRSALADTGSIITGKLDESIRIKNGHNYADIGTSLFYAQYVEEGRGPVHAKNKPYLVFKIPGRGWIRKKSVGPAPARYFVKRSSKGLAKEIPKRLEALGDAIG